MRILVTNDDGISSPGLHHLAQALTALGDVTVFAPSGEYSGAGAAIGHLGPGIPDVHAQAPATIGLPDTCAVYHLDAPPALTALLACSGLFGAPPDVVVSGINPGWNIGHAVHFSGTIGAGVTAQVFHTPALAISQRTTGSTQHWGAAAQAALALAPLVAERGGLWSANAPNVDASDLRGYRQATLCDRIPYGLHSPTLTEVDPGRFTVDFQRHLAAVGELDTDAQIVDAGFVAVTALAPTQATIDGGPLPLPVA
ncbi:MAG: 5'/3'-nucleotidase SurE [Actinomycetota bacterium]